MSKFITNIEIEVSGTITLQLTENDIKKIIEAGGDYDDYISDMSWSRYDIEDINKESVDYSSERIQNAIADYIKNNPELAGKVPNFQTSSEQFLNTIACTKEHFHTSTANLKEIEIDRELLKQVCACAGINHPKNELNYIYFDETNMVATDTRRLAIAEHNTVLNDVYLHKFICDAYCEEESSKLFYNEDVIGNTYIHLHLKEELFFSYMVLLSRPKFVEYQRVIPKFTEHHMSFKVFNARSFDIGEDLEITAVSIQDDKFLFLDSNFIPKDIEIDFYCNEPNLPAVFKNETLTLILMTISISKEDTEYTLAKQTWELLKCGN